MSDRYADHDAAWHRDMETEAAAQEPREDVEALRKFIDGHRIVVDDPDETFHCEPAPSARPAREALDALLARLEEWEGIARRNADLVDEAKARLEQTEREREAVSAHLAACAEKLEAAERRERDGAARMARQLLDTEARVEELLLHPDPLDARFVELQRTAEARMEELQRERDEIAKDFEATWSRAEAAERALREVERYFAGEVPPAGFPIGLVRAALASSEGEER